MPNFLLCALRLLALAVLLLPALALADTSATLATAINIPKGPASIEGFGRAYEVSPATGLPSLSYPIEVPPGRAGHAPALALRYDAGGGAGLVGLGWSLGLPAIERSPRAGLPREGEPPVWILRHLGDGEELTETGPGVYRQRIEQGGPIVVRALPGGAMAAIATDGTGYLFGLTDDARLVGDAGVLRLELSAITDVHGNRIDFHYTRLHGTDAPLLSAITYNDGRARVVFDYEPRPDIIASRALSLRVALAHRLASMRTEVAGEPVRTTTLTYTRSVEAPSSRLVAIATVAADGAALPTWRFDYTDEASTPAARDVIGAPALDPLADGRAWLDVDGDALPDLLEGEPGAWRYRKNLGDARLAATWTDLPSPAVALTPSTRFADLTGDGVQDLLAQPTPGELWGYVGGGAAPFGEADPIPLDLGFDLADPHVALVDLNLDGRIDVLRHDDADGWIWLRRRDSAGYEPADPVPPPPDGMRLGDPDVQLADVDGDRLPDLVRILKADARILVAAGAGLGLFDEPVDLTGVPVMQETDRWELADINGDGAADLLRIGGDGLDLYVNQLDGSLATAGSAAWPALEANEVVIVTDIDGSGTLDILRADTDGSQPWRVWSLYPERPGLLARFENGLGYVREHRYRSAAALAAEDAAAGAPWTTTPPEPLPVLTETREDDGAGWSSTLRRGLRDGWYDPARSEFRGFHELRDETTGDTYTEPATIVRRYDLGQTDDARALQLLSAETRSPRGVLVREEYTLEVDAPAPGVRAVRRAATDTYHVEAGPDSAAIRVRTEWDHDAWGNVTEERALGRVDLKTAVDLPGDERISTTVYAEPTADDAPRDRVAEQTVTDADGTQITATRTYYDGEPEQGLPLGQLGARGVISRTETWIAGDTWAPTLRQRTDAHGNVTQLRDAEGGTLRRRYDAGGLFPVEERFVLGGAGDLVTTATWDARFGQPRSVTAPNGATTHAEYDGLGRLVAEIEPGDTPELPTTRYEYYLDGATARPSIVTERRRVSGEPDVERAVTHLDGLGRAVLDVTQDDASTGAVLSAARRFGARGEVVELRAGAPLPASALMPGARVEIPTAPPPSVTHVDALGRALWTRDADGHDTATTYLALALERRDHEDLHPEPPYTGTPERTEYDGLGRVVAVTTAVSGRSIVQRYEHDAAGRVVAHVDPEGHRTVYAHDGGGRLTDVRSPDAGHVRQRFDRTGRLIERVDATGARVTWTYDPIGRLTDERAFDTSGAVVSAVRRFYDDGGPFARGQLVAAEDDAGRIDFTHDARGRVVRMTRRFDTPSGAITLSTAHEFDAQGRPLRDIYPDGSALDRVYTARGLEAPGAFAEPEYDPLARWRRLSLAPGVDITRELDHTGRVLGQRVTQKSTTLLDLAHRYDVAGQLAETRDRVAAEGFTLSQTYVYDDLRRLVESSAQGKTSRWRYSDDGNLLEQAGRALAYDPTRPHAAVRLDGQHLTYDAAGQLAEVAGGGPLAPGAWRFDPHGRVQSFTAEGGGRVEHVHDYAGERASRREYDALGKLEHEILYFGRDVEVRDGQLVRWIFFAGERIAESPVPMPRGGFAELPAEVVAAVHPSRGPPSPLGLAVLAALVLAALTLLARQLGRAARPRRWVPAAALVLAGLTALSCRHHGGDARPLVPDEHTRYHVADRLGSAALVLDHEGRPLARDAAEPYGAARLAWRSGDAAGPVYRFTGKEDDPLSGAIAIGARHYLPALGRWASPDPLHLLNPAERLEEPGERNVYRYAANNPIANTDPTGHGWISWIIKGGKALGKAVYKGWDKVDEFSGIADDVVTVASAEAGIGARVLSTLSLASEVLPVSAGDVKSTYRWFRGADRVVDAAGSAKAQREAVKRFEELRSGTKAREPSKIDRAAFRKEREEYWKTEAQKNGGNYSPENLAKMQKGRAPKGPDGHPMELHHVDRTPEGGLQPMSRTDHRLGGNFKKNHP